jgi:CO/xanthine dehydrogenase FAD-binding subunit
VKPSWFELARPGELSEVLDLLATHADAKVLAGGQSLVPMMNLRLVQPDFLIDLSRVGGLSDISVADGELRIGAMVRQKALLGNPLIERHAPLIAAAMPYVGHLQTRNRGTVGGSIAHADPAAELPLVVAALDGTLIVQSRRGAREISARAFFIDALTTALEADELLTEIRLPTPRTGVRVEFCEFARRHGDFVIASACVQRSDRELVAALGGVGGRPHICRDLCEAFSRGIPDPDRVTTLIAHEVGLLQPQSDLQASAEYRRHLAGLALTKCLQQVMS